MLTPLNSNIREENTLCLLYKCIRDDFKMIGYYSRWLWKDWIIIYYINIVQTEAQREKESEISIFENREKITLSGSFVLPYIPRYKYMMNTWKDKRHTSYRRHKKSKLHVSSNLYINKTMHINKKDAAL